VSNSSVQIHPVFSFTDIRQERIARFVTSHSKATSVEEAPLHFLVIHTAREVSVEDLEAEKEVEE